MNLLIPYVNLYNHRDPLFEEFTYGDVGQRARKLKNDLQKDDYVFFHTSVGGRKLITAYYKVERVMDTAEAIKDKNIVSKYKNPHIKELKAAKIPVDGDDVILFGDPITSRVLKKRLLFDKALAIKLSLGINHAYPVNTGWRLWGMILPPDSKAPRHIRSCKIRRACANRIGME